MKKSDLYREWARVLDMTEAAGVSWFGFYKIDGISQNYVPDFKLDPARYSFAVAVLEWKPVFVGDVVYHKESGNKIIINVGLSSILAINFTWKKPRTITINGKTFPAPILSTHKDAKGSCIIINSETWFCFKSEAERDAVGAEIVKLITTKD